MGKFFENAQKFGRSFMLPIAILPAAGLFLGIGGALSNPATVSAYSFSRYILLQSAFKIMSTAGAIIFVNLAPIFAIGLLLDLQNQTKEQPDLHLLLDILL